MVKVKRVADAIVIDTAFYYKTPQCIITIRTPQSIAKFDSDNFTIGALLQITTGFITHDSC